MRSSRGIGRCRHASRIVPSHTHDPKSPSSRVSRRSGTGSVRDVTRGLRTGTTAGPHGRDRRSPALCRRLVRSGAVSEPLSAPLRQRRACALRHPDRWTRRRPEPVPHRGRHDRRTGRGPHRGHAHVREAEGALRSRRAVVPASRLGRLLDPGSGRRLLLGGRGVTRSQISLDPVPHARAASERLHRSARRRSCQRLRHRASVRDQRASGG